MDWWSNKTAHDYKERAQCIINQYGNYTAHQIGLNLNGINTQGENIADNGGVKESYLAYSEYNVAKYFINFQDLVLFSRAAMSRAMALSQNCPLHQCKVDV